jgi:hypothetical protein
MATISTDSMTLKNRTELKSLFKNKSYLSASHFAELIDSLLNKRDDQFHGVWKPGQTYQKGDVVYYEGALWEMKAENEICAKDGEEPGKGDKWKSRLKELEQKVDKIQHDLEALSKEFTEYKQRMELRLQQLLRYLTLLTLGVAIALVWLFGGSIYHLLTGAG